MSRWITPILLALAMSAQCQTWEAQTFQWRNEFASRPEGAYGQYWVWLRAGATYEIQTRDLVAGDPVLYLLDVSGQQVAWDDDSGGRYNGRIRHRAPRSAFHRVRLRSFSRGTTGRCSLSVRVLPPPTIVSSVGTQAMAQEGTRMQFLVWARDPDGRPVPVHAEGLLPLRSVVYGPTPASFEWTPGYNQAGRYEVSFVARTTDGRTSRIRVGIEVAETNRSPVLSIGREELIVALETETVTFDVTASDPDGGALGPVEAESLGQGMSFVGSRFRFETGWNSAGQYVVAFRASEAAPGGLVGRLEVRIVIEDAPTRTISILPRGASEELTVTLFLPDGVRPYTEDFSPQDGSGVPLDSSRTIDAVSLPFGYASVSDLAVRFPLQARDWRESIHSIAPYREAGIRFWSVYVVDVRDREGRPAIYSSELLWPLLRAVIPGGAVDFLIGCNASPTWGGAAFPEFRTTSLTVVNTREWGAHEFSHLLMSRSRPYSMLGDEYGLPALLSADPPGTRSFRQRIAGRFSIRLRTPTPGGAGRCTVRVSPRPTEEALCTPPDRLTTLADGTEAAEWVDREYGWRAPSVEPWFAPGVAYPLASRGEYNEIRVRFEYGTDYRIELMDVVPGPNPGSGIVEVYRAWRTRPHAIRDLANLTATPPRLDGGRWVGAPWDHLMGPDPFLTGKQVGWYEAGQEGLYRPTIDGRPLCQMAAGGAAPLCRVCRAAMDQTLALDSAGSSEVRDDLGPRPRFNESDFRPNDFVVREGEWITGHFEAVTLDGAGRSSIAFVEAIRIPPGSGFFPASGGGFAWRPSPGQAGVHTVELRAVTTDGRVGLWWRDITVLPSGPEGR